MTTFGAGDDRECVELGVEIRIAQRPQITAMQNGEAKW